MSPKHAKPEDPDEYQMKPFDVNARVPLLHVRAGRGLVIASILFVVAVLGCTSMAFHTYQYVHQTNERLNSLEAARRQRTAERDQELRQMRKEVHDSEERQRRIDCSILEKFPAPPGSGVARARKELKCPPTPAHTPG